MPDSLLLTTLKGLLLSLGLIVAIGPQNIYVLRKGLARRHIFAVASACFTIDAALLLAGGIGIGALITASERLESMAAWAGALFLAGYGLWNFRAALHPDVITPDDIESTGEGAHGKGAGAAALMALTLSVLNPHLWFDTLVVIGSVAGQYEGAARIAFTAGTVVGSALWFYGLGYGAGLLAPLFRTARAWRLLDVFSGLIMLGVAVMLVHGQLA